MRRPWMVYVIVAVLSIGAAVAIAGLPDDAAVEPTVIPSSTIEAPAPTTEAATASPDATDPATTVPDTTEPGTTVPDSTQPEPSTPETTEAPTTTEPASTTPDTTAPETALPDRGEIITVTANGAGVAGTATRWSELLEGLGYVDVQPRDGTQIVDLSVVYYADGFEGAAGRLAEDMLLLPEFVAPLQEAPVVLALPEDTQLMAYVGLDRT